MKSSNQRIGKRYFASPYTLVTRAIAAPCTRPYGNGALLADRFMRASEALVRTSSFSADNTPHTINDKDQTSL